MLEIAIQDLVRIQQMVFSEPWMVTLEKYDSMCLALESRLAGIRTEGTAFSLPALAEPYTTPEGVRVIPVHGVMSKRANLVTQASGGVSTEVVGNQIDDALVDYSVKGIVLDIDSPGGAVDGTFALHDKIAQAAQQKPIASFIDGQACSGGYAIASAASYIVTSEEAMVGHIGVVMTRTDRSKANERSGVSREVFTSGKYKAAMGTSDAPLNDDGRAEIQALLDSIYSLFVGKVADARGVSAEQAHDQMGDGRTWIGANAVSAGLVDSVGTLQDAINAVVSETRKNTGYPGVSAINPPRDMRGEKESPAMLFFGKKDKQESKKPEGASGTEATAAKTEETHAEQTEVQTKPAVATALEALQQISAASVDEIKAVCGCSKHLGLSVDSVETLLTACATGTDLSVVLQQAIGMSAKKNGGPVKTVAEHTDTPIKTQTEGEEGEAQAMAAITKSAEQLNGAN